LNYILSYNYCNLDKVEYSGTDITCISDDVLSEAGLCVRFAGCCSILQTGHITLSSTPDKQLENHSTRYHR